MANIANSARTTFAADRRNNNEYWQYVLDMGTQGDEWSTVNLIIPQNVLDGLLFSVVVETRNAPATARDLDAQRERWSLSVNRGGQLANAVLSPRVVIGDNISNWNVGVGAVATDGWISRGEIREPIWFGRDDLFAMVIPPTDASSTPTADAVVWLGVQNLKYTKQ